MIYPSLLEGLTTYIEKGKNIFFFIADWRGDCRFIEPVMLKIEEASLAPQFIEIDRDQFIDVVAERNIFNTPSFVVIGNGQELGRLVNKDRRTKEETSAFLTSLG